jgi:peptide-methionine (S)-S-oxide reductase
MKEAIFGAGCFWCVEAVFQQIKGVKKLESGYMGGKIKNPTYREVCSGLTDHAEIVKITYDEEQVSFEELLEVFWKTHDPTTLNKQGADTGTQYRSVIFYVDERQKTLATAYKNKLNTENVFGNPVVTEISLASEFYVAETQHQNYYNDNSQQPYCSFVVKPKVDKVKKLFADKLN